MSESSAQSFAVPQDLEVFFFHLQTRPLESVLPKLLLKTLRRNWRACVWFHDQEVLGTISEALWNIPHEWILPHGMNDEPYPERHPLWLSHQNQCPNHADVLFLCGGIWQQSLLLPTSLARLCFMIEPTDQPSTKAARALWNGCDAAKRQFVKV